MMKEEKPMPSYLFVESRDPFESRDVEEGYRLVAELAAQQSPVTLFLVQNGVLAARQGARAAQFTVLAAHPGVTVLADTFALHERGMPTDALVSGVQASDIDTLVDLLMTDDQKAIWH
jgi:sulfur relay (sulfurtransferase) DsrF/TusC family protein